MSSSMVDTVVNRFFSQYVTERDRTLLSLVFHPSPEQHFLDETIERCDIEAMGSHRSLMLSYCMLEHPELTFSSYVKPRLKGLMDFYRFANIQTLAHFSKIGKAMNKRKITPLIVKGAAMKYLRPSLSRPMGDVDILIPAHSMQEAVKVCLGLGYEDAMTGLGHAVDIQTPDGKGAVDIHTAIIEGCPNSKGFHQGLVSRARVVVAFGVRVLLPAHEDLLFIVLANLTKNLRAKTSVHGLMYALLDVKFLLSDKPDFNWAIVKENIKNTDSELPVRFGAEFINSLVPDLVPDLDANLPLSPAMDAYCNEIVFDEDHFSQRQAYCQAIRIVDLKNYPRHFGKIILKYLLLKKLRKYPAFVRWYLKRKESQGAHRAG